MAQQLDTSQPLIAELPHPVLVQDEVTPADKGLASTSGEKSQRPRVWVVSELYHPELTSTGYFLTCIAEGLAETNDVSVLCGQPSYWLRGVRAPTREERNGVDIRRCWATTLDKNRTLFKISNMLTISGSMFLASIGHIRRQDAVIVVTNPPLLPYVVALACRVKGARLILLVHDVYPEILVQLGFLKARSASMALMNFVSRWLYESASRVLVLGRDMRDLVAQKLTHRDLIAIAPNWADAAITVPEPRQFNQLLASLGISEKFVVQYWGNMGRPHCIEDLIEAASMLTGEPEIHFLLVGWGTKKAWVVAELKKRELHNVTFIDPLPREKSCEVQNACDLAINTLSSGMTGISVPSRSYNAMAAAKPTVAVCDADSELALTVREEGIGWVVPPGRPDLLAAALREAHANPERVRAMGERAREVIEAKYERRHVLKIYQDIIEGLQVR
jgi:colanic acid biosynthesis glycosyl transferase WcaI